LSLQDDVRKYVPEVPTFDPSRPIRLDDLSRHRSGLRDFTDAARPLNDAGALSWVAQQTSLDVPTGTRWQYRNVNYFLLARVVERVSRRSFREFVEAEVFNRAGMTHARVLDAPTTVIRNRAIGYCFGRPCASGFGPTGAGGVFASLEDMIAWDRALARGTLVS